MVKTEERLDSDVISNIQWDCEKIDEDSDHVKKTATVDFGHVKKTATGTR